MTDEAQDCCARDSSAMAVADRFPSQEVMDHNHYLAAQRVRSVLDGLEALYGTPARTSVDEAVAELSHEKDWRLSRVYDELGAVVRRAESAEHDAVVLAEHLVELHDELRHHVEGLAERTTPAKHPKYVKDLLAMVDRQADTINEVMSRAIRS